MSLRAEFRAEMKSQVRSTLLTGLAWVTVLMVGQGGLLYAVLN